MTNPSASLPELSYHLTLAGKTTGWRIKRVRLVEEISRPYELIVEILHDPSDPLPEHVLGADASLAFMRDEHPARDVHGVVLRIEQLDRQDTAQHLRLVIGPALAMFAQTQNTRIWQECSVLQVVVDVLERPLKALGRNLRLDLTPETYAARDFCVQYRESDLAFVSRLLQEEGISYRFADIDAHAETLVLFDANERCPNLPPLHFVTRGTAVAEASVDRFEPTRQLTATGVTQRDWAPFLAADAPFIHTRCARDEHQRERIIYDHEDHRCQANDDGAMARRKLEQHAWQRMLVHGQSNVYPLSPGLRFELSDHPDPRYDRSYLLVRVEHHGEVADAERLGPSDDLAVYRNEFRCIPTETAYRPLPDPNNSPPRVHGPHTAIVVGPETEEIHTDVHGRIKVRFHWDRRTDNDADAASCWLRVAQTWAGAGWGSMFVPRIGMEVLVQFIDGDPARPLVVGCVYNSVNTPPLTLPGDKTCSVLQSESSPGGGLANMLRFEDGRGRESLTLQTRRDLVTRAGHNHHVHVANDQKTVVAANMATCVEGNQSTLVMSNCTLTVSDGDFDTHVCSGSQTVRVQGDQHTTIVDGHCYVDVHAGGHILQAQQDVQACSLAGDLVLLGQKDVTIAAHEHQLRLHGQQKAWLVSHNDDVEISAQKAVQILARTDNMQLQAHTDVLAKADTGNIELAAAEDITIAAEGDANIRGRKITICATDTLELRVGLTAIVLKPGSIHLQSPAITSAAIGEHVISGALIRLN